MNHKSMFRNYLKLISPFSCCLLLITATTDETTQNANPPNIIYVLADDLGYADIQGFSSPDYSKIQTPHLFKMGEEGMRFTDAHTASSVCTPTRYSILTGRYNWRSTLKRSVLWGYDDALIDTDRTTVASLLSAHGYHTAFIGKWHLGWNWAKDENGAVDFTQPISNSPNDLGFDYAYGHVASLDIPPYVYVENEKATSFPKPGDTIAAKKDYEFWRKGIIAPDFVHDDVTPNFFRRSFQYIEERAQTGKPFFLYLPLPSPHTPILPLEKWQGKSGLNPYGDFVMMIDDYMGDLFQVLKDNDIDENTLVIFTSDNGCSPTANFPELNAKGHWPNHPFRGHKADIYEGGHRVPFIVRWPKKVSAGSVNHQTIATTDLMATAASLVDYELKDHEGEDSYDMMPLLTGQELEGSFREGTVHHSMGGAFAIRQGDWKLIMTGGSGGWSEPNSRQAEAQGLPPIQLYNLGENLYEDPEQNNLQSAYPKKVEELTALLNQYILDGRSTPGAVQSNDGEKEIWDQLWWLLEP
ncbi:MAG: arylsulfatase [Flavobacteriaceae bacterium]|nr:arylsulfatase [Flavobacteriaceae bacterium]MCY4267640.1 arylsulfatase [Flavobacteriaceae bacterium]